MQHATATRRRVRRAGKAVFLLGAAMALALAGCGDDGESAGVTTTTNPRNDFSQPDWVDEVYPPADGNAAELAVAVEYGPLDRGQEIRLVIDGIDVTSQTEGIARVPGVDAPGDPQAGAANPFPSPGRLRYEPTAIDFPLVDLSPGEHQATAKLVVLEQFGGTLRTLDEYDWTFTFQ